MIRKVHADKANRTVTLEITESDLSNIIDSIDNMVDKQQRTLLENLPAEDRVRSKLDSYKALREDLRKVWEGIV
ncbi:MAG: hypothetical protein QOA14_09265 [Nitrososphaeraceae archaeon]|nr:hypothetical protein [Nitrososphaeraceae archaeon]MDW0188266.1 hypothetical protein [Nitrososphaeraceae archaeon]MDW0205631.1 hypothetical protein [Nitrososphaeraceae archaeon]MDW0243547.1 hypothetical protein [Nitrososphaeraceae archaeon]MDW0250089.1 hypothetical protein [Nitrososphaeraceae archaeon]